MNERKIILSLIFSVLLLSSSFVTPSVNAVSIPPTPAINKIITSNDTVQAKNYSTPVTIQGTGGITVSGNNDSKIIYVDGSSLGSGNATSLNDLSDVSVTNPQEGDFLSYLSGIWQNIVFGANSITCSAGQFFNTYDNQTHIFGCATSSGESTTASNLLGTFYWFAQLVGSDLQFYGLDLGQGLSGTQNGTTIKLQTNFKVNNSTCSGTNKFSAYDNATGDHVCSADVDTTGITSVSNADNNADAKMVYANSTTIAIIKGINGTSGQIGVANGTTSAVISLVPKFNNSTCTSGDFASSYDNVTGNTVCTTPTASAITTGIVVYPLSTTIGDYTTPSASSASSPANSLDDGTSYVDQTAYDNAWASSDTAKDRGSPTNDNIAINVVIDTSNDAIACDLQTTPCILSLGTTASNTAWVLRFTIRFSSLTVSGNNVFMLGLFDSSQTTSGETAQDGIYSKFQNTAGSKFYYANDADGTAPASAGNDASQSLTWATSTNYFVEMKRLSATSYTIELFINSDYTTGSQGKLTGTAVSTTQSLRYIKIMNRVITGEAGAWVGTIDDVRFCNGVTTICSSTVPYYIFDGNTSTEWASNSEINPNIYVDMGSAVNPVAVALYYDATTTTVTQFKVQVSTDASTWNDVRVVNTNLLTNGAYNYFRWDIYSVQERYVRFYGTDGSAKVFAIWEIKILKPSDALLLINHGHKSISTSDGTTALNT